MRNITYLFEDVAMPLKALLVYESMRTRKIFVEAYDFDRQGRPINASPLSTEEAALLAKKLDITAESRCGFLQGKGVFAEHILYTSNRHEGYAIWYTPPQAVTLHFVDDLTIPTGKANVPGLIWKATASELRLYAYKGAMRPTGKTALYHAPFFNLYPSGLVCMGTVDVETEECRLEEFVQAWQDYFWNSYFSHLLAEHNPVNGNIVQLWQGLIGSGNSFPAKALIKNGQTIQTIIK